MGAVGVPLLELPEREVAERYEAVLEIEKFSPPLEGVPAEAPPVVALLLLTVEPEVFGKAGP